MRQVTGSAYNLTLTSPQIYRHSLTVITVNQHGYFFILYLTVKHTF
jgi:hypothetical protein